MGNEISYRFQSGIFINTTSAWLVIPGRDWPASTWPTHLYDIDTYMWHDMEAEWSAQVLDNNDWKHCMHSCLYSYTMWIDPAIYLCIIIIMSGPVLLSDKRYTFCLDMCVSILGRNRLQMAINLVMGEQLVTIWVSFAFEVNTVDRVEPRYKSRRLSNKVEVHKHLLQVYNSEVGRFWVPACCDSTDSVLACWRGLTCRSRVIRNCCCH